MLKRGSVTTVACFIQRSSKEDSTTIKENAECLHHSTPSSSESLYRWFKSSKVIGTRMARFPDWTSHLLVFIFLTAVKTATSQRIPGDSSQSGDDNSSHCPVLGWESDLCHRSSIVLLISITSADPPPPKHSAGLFCWGLHDVPWATLVHKLQKQQRPLQNEKIIYLKKLHAGCRKLRSSKIQENSSNAKSSK